MIATTQQKFTFEEYIRYDDGTDNRYELEDGELILMNPPTGRHALIIRLLSNAIEAEIARLQLPWVALNSIGVRTSINRARIPDLCVTTRQQILEKLEVSAIIDSALLAVEVVSPESINRDYRFKRSEYGVAGIPEYWIVDPMEQKVTVLSLVDGFYEEAQYQGSNGIVSQTFPQLQLTAEQILQG